MKNFYMRAVKRTIKSATTAAALSCVLVGGVSQAWADHDTETTVITINPTTTTLAVGLVTMAMAANPFSSSTTSTTSATDTLFGSNEASERYIRCNAPAIEQGIAMGAGDAVKDLARMANIREEDHAAFGRLLRTHRKTLTPLLNTETLTSARARNFSRIIEGFMSQQETLSGYVRART